MTNNSEKKTNKINNYIAIFFIFLAMTIVVFILTRYQFSSVTPNAEASKQPDIKSEQIVTAKYADLSPEKEKILKSTSGENFMGNEYAPVLMIEYASLSCPHCAEMHEKVIEKLIPKYIETGKLKFVYRHFPLNAQAFSAAKLTLCADDEKYFGYVKALFKSQENWAYTEKYEDILKSIAKLGGIPAEQFDKCMKDKEIEEQILQVQKDAVDILEVKSTPTLFINGHQYNGGNDYNKVAEFIDSLLKGE